MDVITQQISSYIVLVDCSCLYITQLIWRQYLLVLSWC